MAAAHSAASAQDADRVERARVEFADAMAAIERGDWVAARDAFERAHALAPRPGLRLNLGSARIRTGQLIEGAADLRAVLSEAGSDDPEIRAAAREQLEALEARIPTITVGVIGALTGVRTTVDGVDVEPGEAVRVDPGAHSVELWRGDARLAARAVEVAEGARERVQMVALAELAPPEPTVGPPPAIADEGEDLATDGAGDGSLMGVWIGVAGGGLIAAVVGVAVAVWLASDTPPFVGNVPPGRVGLP